MFFGEPVGDWSSKGWDEAVAQGADFQQRLLSAARARTRVRVTYDGGYRRIPYPMGDVPDHIGVCTDLIIRSYRALGIDLQQQVHEDMKKNFSKYPKLWGLRRPDSNIDHRRVPNLQVFFRRHGKELKISGRPEDYRAGELVTWMLNGDSLPHIGIVSNRKVEGTQRPKIIHNIGQGPVEDDILFQYPISGHYSYSPEPPN